MKIPPDLLLTLPKGLGCFAACMDLEMFIVHMEEVNDILKMKAFLPIKFLREPLNR
jgi:hypothetical protein